MRVIRIAILFLLALAALPVNAQDRARFGVKLGVTSAELRTGTEEGPLSGGVNLGGFVALPVHGAWSALASVDYYRKGYSEGHGYASLLVAPHYRAVLGSTRAALYVFSGPRLDAFLGDSIDAADQETGNVNAGPASAADMFNTVVFGASAGAGLELTDTVAGSLLIELRYDADLTPARSLQDSEQRFRTFSLRLGLSF